MDCCQNVPYQYFGLFLDGCHFFACQWPFAHSSSFFFPTLANSRASKTINILVGQARAQIEHTLSYLTLTCTNLLASCEESHYVHIRCMGKYMLVVTYLRHEDFCKTSKINKQSLSSQTVAYLQTMPLQH